MRDRLKDFQVTVSSPLRLLAANMTWVATKLLASGDLKLTSASVLPPFLDALIYNLLHDWQAEDNEDDSPEYDDGLAIEMEPLDFMDDFYLEVKLTVVS